MQPNRTPSLSTVCSQCLNMLIELTPLCHCQNQKNKASTISIMKANVTTETVAWDCTGLYRCT